MAQRTTKACSIDGCENKYYARGWCGKHYQRWAAHGDPTYLVPRKSCKEDGCENRHAARGWCMRHYNAWSSYGDPLHHEKKGRKSLVCDVPTCAKEVVCRIWCEPHYRKFLKYGDPEYVRPEPAPNFCSIDDCARAVYGRGWCGAHYRRWYTSGNPLGREILVCRTCGQPFRAVRPDAVNCSSRCTREDRQRNKYGHRERKVRIQDAFVEVVKREVLYNRDNWICGICKKSVDPTSAYPDPWSPSLDHIIPLSKGGEHSYQNCQLAHLRCNIQKGDRMS